jgi:uncharacterized protein (TIGR01777 family)
MDGAMDKQMGRVGVIGASGFVGRAVGRELASAGIGVTGFSRRPESAEGEGVGSWRCSRALDISGLDAVVNLAGEPINRRWTAARRQRFHESRAGLTGRLVETIGKLAQEDRPRVLVNASAVGIYGDRGDEELDESAAPGDGYLEDLCKAWESAAIAAEDFGVRVVMLRIGVVLGRGGGALELMRRVFSLGLGGRLGSGNQWVPWIHLADLARAVHLAVSDPDLRGPVNGAAPGVVRNREFTKMLAARLRRPAILPAPGFALKAVLGGFGEVLLGSQRVVPGALQDAGFEFRYSEIESALADLLGREPLGREPSPRDPEG